MKLIETMPAEIEKLLQNQPEEVDVLLDHNFLDKVRARFKKRVFEYEIPKTGFPQIIVHVPSSWPCFHLAPLFDVHKGHSLHDAPLFARHKKWIIDTPNVLTFDGGDMIENASKLSIGAGVYEQKIHPQEQLHAAAYDLADLHHKTLLKVPGNHEDRSLILGVDVGRWLATLLDIPYFPDYSFLTIKFAGNNYRVLIHHGTGSAVTAGAQTMAARKDLAWAKPFDVFWCFPAGTPVLTADGTTKAIETIRAGDRIISGSGKLATVGGLSCQEYDGQANGPLPKLRPWGWPWDITPTPNHPMCALRRYSRNDRREGFHRADALVYKDALKKVSFQRTIVEPDVSESRMRLYGYYLAEGCGWVSKKRIGAYQLTFSFSEDERFTLVEDCKKLLLEELGYEAKIQNNKTKSAVTLRVCKKEAVAHFRTLLGHYADCKKVPEAFLHYPDGHIRQLLEGLFAGDGHSSRQGRTLTTTSKALAEQALLLLGVLGEPASLGFRDREKKKRSYTVFRDHSEGSEAYRKYVRYNDQWYSPLRLVDYQPFDGSVYTLQIEGEDPTFVVGQYVVHNTGHLHSSKLDVLYQIDFDQKTQEAYERNGLVIISPSYLKFFGGYSAKKRYSPGIRGLHAVTFHKDGRIDATIHAKGVRK